VHEKRGKVGVGAVSVCVSGKGMEHRGGDQYFHYFTVHSPIEFSSTAYSPVDNGMDGRHKVWYTEGVYDSHDAPCYSTSRSKTAIKLVSASFPCSQRLDLQSMHLQQQQLAQACGKRGATAKCFV